jgi:RNA polymerase sigma-70 factor, ECF subfamily
MGRIQIGKQHPVFLAVTALVSAGLRDIAGVGGKQKRGSPGSGHVMEGQSTVDDARARAFREHVEPEIEVMLRVALSLTRRRADAEDLVQESLIRAFRALDTFDGRHPRAWLLTIVRRTHLNMNRRQRPDLVADWDVVGDQRPPFGASTAASAEQAHLDGSLSSHLTTALKDLDPRFRAVVFLVDIHDLSYAEAAAVLGVPVGTVMSRLSRARNRLRAALGPELLTPGRSS